MTLKARLLEVAGSIVPEQLEFKKYGKGNKDMATTRTITFKETLPVPGTDKVGRCQVTFCVNFLDIASPETYKNRQKDNAEGTLSAMPVEERRAFLERQLAELA